MPRSLVQTVRKGISGRAGDLHLTFYPAAASPAQWRGARRGAELPFPPRPALPRCVIGRFAEDDETRLRPGWSVGAAGDRQTSACDLRFQICDLKIEIAEEGRCHWNFGKKSQARGHEMVWPLAGFRNSAEFKIQDSTARIQTAQMRFKIQDPRFKIRDRVRAARWPQPRGRCRACWRRYAC